MRFESYNPSGYAACFSLHTSLHWCFFSSFHLAFHISLHLEGGSFTIKVADKYQMESLIKEGLRILKAEVTKFNSCQQEKASEQKIDPIAVVTCIEVAETYNLKEFLPELITCAVTLDSKVIMKSRISQETRLEIFRRREESFERLICS